MAVPASRSHLRLLVSRPFSATFSHNAEPVFEPIETVDCEWARWRDGQSEWAVLQVRSDADKLTMVRHFHAIGSTCETAYGRWVKTIEAFMRLAATIRFHWLGACQVVH